MRPENHERSAHSIEAKREQAIARSLEAYARLTAKCQAAEEKQAELAAKRAAAWAMTSDDVAFLRACGIQP